MISNIICDNDCSYLDIHDNVITFLEDGKYFIEYADSDKVELNFQVLEGKKIVLYEYSF